MYKATLEDGVHTCGKATRGYYLGMIVWAFNMAECVCIHIYKITTHLMINNAFDDQRPI